MAHDSITEAVSERYARAATTGEQMCCPTGYNFDDPSVFFPDVAVLKSSSYRRHFAFNDRTYAQVQVNETSCSSTRSCC